MHRPRIYVFRLSISFASFSFLFIGTLHWCKHCTGLDVAPNLRKFPFTALCVIAAEAVVCRSVNVGAHFAPTKDLRFQALHLLSFLFIGTLHWCKHCTGLHLAQNLRKFAFTAQCVTSAEVVVCRSVAVQIHGAVRNCGRGGRFQVRHRWCAFCTDPGFTFSGSPSP